MSSWRHPTAPFLCFTLCCETLSEWDGACSSVNEHCPTCLQQHHAHSCAGQAPRPTSSRSSRADTSACAGAAAVDAGAVGGSVPVLPSHGGLSDGRVLHQSTGAVPCVSGGGRKGQGGQHGMCSKSQQVQHACCQCGAPCVVMPRLARRRLCRPGHLHTLVLVIQALPPITARTCMHLGCDAAFPPPAYSRQHRHPPLLVACRPQHCPSRLVADTPCWLRDCRVVVGSFLACYLLPPPPGR